MKGRVAFVILVLAATGLAAALRLPELALRPMHCDEAVHAYKLGEMIEGGHSRYHYDPVEYHGPTLNYCTLLVTKLCGITRYADLDEVALRIVPAAFGIGMVLLLLAMRDGLGFGGAVVAAVLTAVSTCMAYYSRYFIMEVLLVFFTFLAIVGAWRYVRGGSAFWCVVAGIGVGLMHATKETWVFVPVALGIAMLVNTAWCRWVEGEKLHFRRHVVNGRVLVAAAVGVFAAVALLSSLFTNWQGPVDSVMTYLHGLRRAGGGSGAEAGDLHVNPWYFYLRRLVWFRIGRGPIWTEAVIVALALAGTVAGFLRRGLGKADAGLVRVLGVYSFVLLAIYTIIPYKTPWCLMGPLHGMILVAGVGAVALVRLPLEAWAGVARGAGRAERRFFRRWIAVPQSVLLALVIAAGAVHLGLQTWRADRKQYDSPYNPWVYAHTLRDTVRLGRRVDELAALHPDGYHMRINFISPDPHDQWPLPWYLRRFDQSRVGYHVDIPNPPDADVLIFRADLWPRIEPHLGQGYEWEYRGLRPSINLLLGVEASLWKKYIRQLRAKMEAEKRAKSARR